MSFHAAHVSLTRARRTVLCDVELSILPGEIVGLLGPNGAGKSTLMAVMAGELQGESGAVKIGPLNIEQLSTLEQARRRAVVTQQSSLNFALRVSDVLRMGAYPYPQASQEQIDQWIKRALTVSGLLSLQEKVYTALSGGEQQRVQLARALVQCFAIEHEQGAAYLLLDEPLVNLDPRYQIQFMQVLEQLVGSTRMGVLMVVHDLNLAARHCHRLYLLNEGRMIANGVPNQVLTPQSLKQAFGVDWEVIAHPRDSNRLLVLT